MLPKLEGFAAALVEAADKSVVETIARDLASVEQTVLSRSDLRAVLTDTSLSGPVRSAVVGQLLEGKVSAESLRIVRYAAQYVAAQEVPQSIGEVAVAVRAYLQLGSFEHGTLSLLDARRRVAGFIDATLEFADNAQFSTIENQLFAWARTVEDNVELRRLLLDRDAPLAARVGTSQALLQDKVLPLTWKIAKYVLVGGRPRDVVGTIDFAVTYVAQLRDWRIARVRTAFDLSDANKKELVASLASLTGKNVELQVESDKDLLGGVIVEVGDLRLDASTKGRLGALRDVVASGQGLTSVLNRND
jgi:F-type H+-transporting ATPase subunit delta